MGNWKRRILAIVLCAAMVTATVPAMADSSEGHSHSGESVNWEPFYDEAGMAIINGTKDLDREFPFTLLSGDDSLTLPILSFGGKGVISVTANIEPKRMVELYNRFMKCDIKGSIDMHYELMELSKAMFMDVNPVPVKRASELRGLINCGNVRLPLDNLSPEMTGKLKEVLSHYD